MALVPYDPFRSLDNWRQEVERFFTDFPTNINGERQISMPRVDIHETKNEVIATCDIPGIEKKDDINIVVENNILHISGTINRSTEINEGQFHRQERMVGHFRRSISLPNNVSNEEVKASYKNGVLQINMSKVKNDNKREINVKFH